MSWYWGGQAGRQDQVLVLMNLKDSRLALAGTTVHQVEAALENLLLPVASCLSGRLFKVSSEV